MRRPRSTQLAHDVERRARAARRTPSPRTAPRRREVNTRCDTSVNSRAPSAHADDPGERRHQPRHPAARRPTDRAEHGVGEQLVVPPARATAGQRVEPVGEPASRPVVALGAAPRRCAGTSGRRRGRCRRCRPSKPLEHLVEARRGPSGACSGERRLRLQRHGVEHAERAEADPGEAKHVGVLGLAGTQRRAVGEHQLAGPTTWVASPPNRRPVPWVPVEIAPAMVCSSMSPRLVSARARGRAARGSAGAAACPACTVTRAAASSTVDHAVEPVEPQLHVARDGRRAVKEWPAADGPHPRRPSAAVVGHAPRPSRRSRRRHHLDAVGPLVARPVAPASCAGRPRTRPRLVTVPTSWSPQHARLDRATRDLDAPVAVVDLDAFDANAADLRPPRGRHCRSGWRASRCAAAAAAPGAGRARASPACSPTRCRRGAVAGRRASSDVVVGYPTADRSALRAAGRRPGGAPSGSR